MMQVKGLSMRRYPGGYGLPCLILALVLAACDQAPPPPAADPRPVRVISVAERAESAIVTLTGTIQAQTEVNLGFRIDGRMVERLVNVGDRVEAGQVIARLDPTTEENSLRAARAALWFSWSMEMMAVSRSLRSSAGPLRRRRVSQRVQPAPLCLAAVVITPVPSGLVK